MSKGIFIEGITVEMLRNASLEAVEDLMNNGDMVDLEVNQTDIVLCGECKHMMPDGRCEEFADRPKGECPDCIDRQELIGSIQYLFDGLADSWVEASEKIIEIIREEPTVPQKEYTEQQIRDTFNSGYSCGMQNEWITDEPPVDGQEVIATVYWTDYGDSITAYGHYNARFDKWRLYSDIEGELNKGFEVIAWMPLPEPYKGGEDE